MKKEIPISFIFSTLTILHAVSQEKCDDVAENFSCTTITAGKKATADGSVMTSHTDDSGRAKTWIEMVPEQDHDLSEKVILTKRKNIDTTVMRRRDNVKIGEIPQIEHTWGYINSEYPCLNNRQLGIGESTFGGRKSLQSDSGLINCNNLCRLMMERSTTARGAIELADRLTKQYGWKGAGECLTIADKKEVWHFEILGSGKNKKGAVWAAQRVPDDHVSVCANASRIRQIDLDNPDYFMASDNVFYLAKDSGWWNPDDGLFEFCYAYAPKSRTHPACKLREWRVLDYFAPSLNLHPNSENYPFSVKPDKPVTLEMMKEIFSDYYEGTEFFYIKNLTITDDSGKTVLSPFANPFMPFSMNKMFNINGTWGWRGERNIACYFTVYATIIQCRDWLPDDIGGVAWFGWDNVATSVYIPIYGGVTDVPESYKIRGRETGYNRKSAWWGFNRLSTIAGKRWGDMRKDVDTTWKPYQKQLFDNQKTIEEEAMVQPTREKRIRFLTGYTIQCGNTAYETAWELGDFLWSKYSDGF